ncbi:unnamed protein product [Prorocentrum cordatum]|uniref:Uncharacterized protein n=1 Tax=Prorocentrum cordatum TaxID=2364126 RepID=A0ABN9VBC6_9DINO|nr:unnamed protein product [Polarella glacialis]
MESILHKGKGSTLRFPIGTQVLCQTSYAAEGWEPGVVVDHWYTQDGFPEDYFAPYQVQLDDDTLIFIPEDTPKLCRERVPAWWERAFKTSGEAPAASEVLAAASGADADERNHSGTTALAASAHNAPARSTTRGGALFTLRSPPGAPRPSRCAPRCRRSWRPGQTRTHRTGIWGGTRNSKQVVRGARQAPHTLHYCAAWDYTAAAELLLKARADPTIIDGQYMTPLHLAIDEGCSREMVSLLLAGKSDPDKAW